MKQIMKSALLAGAIAMSLSGLAVADRDNPTVLPRPSGDGVAQDVVAADLGTGYNILTIPAPAFAPRTAGVTFDYAAQGYIYPTALGSDLWTFWAPLQLPSGAGIGYLDLHAYDTSANDITAQIRTYTGFGSRPQCTFPILCPSVSPSNQSIVSVSSTGTGGYQYMASDQLNPLHTVNNNVVFGGGAFYTVLVAFPSVGQSLLLRGVDIWWKRQIKPGPATASFTDVPLGAQFFAEVEAMKAAGITGGCTATEYCPDLAVTRRQMAAFLARAMGLYWGQ